MLAVTAVVFMAVCGLSVAQDSYGITYGDVGADAPFLQSLSPDNGPKQGSTDITISGAGFKDDSRLTCRFQRLDPVTATNVIKTTAATYVSSTQVTCKSPSWEESSRTLSGTYLQGTFSGHMGSPYLRSTSTILTTEIGVGDVLELAAAETGSTTTMTQYYRIKAIEDCGTPSTTGCVCTSTWGSSAYQVAQSYNGTSPGSPGAAANSGYEVMTATDTNCAMYRYDKLSGGAGDSDSPLPRSMWPSNAGATCTPTCASSAWAAGTKITLSEPVWKVPGTANTAFSGKQGMRVSKFHCTDCKCAEGCAVTVSVTNDGKKYSGSGSNGKAWTGSGLSFSLKEIVPTVQYIDHAGGLGGYRDSTRIFGPPSGGTSLDVYGENFQDSDLLRCYFDSVKTLVKAEWISSNKVRCKTPAFFSRQLQSGADSNQDGAARTPHTKVQVTNTGSLDMGTDCEKCALSQNPFLDDDGSKMYTKTFDHRNTYNDGMTGFMSNPFRSTCQEGMYPNEEMAPCWGAHTADQTMGNDVLFKYATCFDANAAGGDQTSGVDFITGNTGSAGGRSVNTSSSPGQTIQLTAAAMDGPVAYMDLHLSKASEAEAVIEVSINSGTYASPTPIAKETIVVGKISTTDRYHVFFNTPAYLLSAASQNYQVILTHKSGAEDVMWKYTTGTGHTGASFNAAARHKLQIFTCDGCRTTYQFDPTSTVVDTIKFGERPTADVLASTSRSMAAQSFRPSETGTITKVALKLKNIPDNQVQQSYVSIWVTKHGAYGEYVCSTLGSYGSPDGVPQPADNLCDNSRDGSFTEACMLGSVCNPGLGLNGGCGRGGVCSMAEVVNHGHRLRPESGGAAGPCGDSANCAMTMTLSPDHRKIVKDNVGASGTWEEFEFKYPVSVEKHVTYFLNAAVVGNTDISKVVSWMSGTHPGDGGYAYAQNSNVAPGGWDATLPTDELRYSFVRDKDTSIWSKQPNLVLATKFTRCVSSTAQVMGFTTSGAPTGCCTARASPQGGDKGAMITITGRNFFPSDNLKCVFHDEAGNTMATVPGKVLDSNYTLMECAAPTMDPHSGHDCTNPELCQGVTLVVTNDGFTVGPQFMGPKWHTQTSPVSGTPAYLGQNPLKFLFSDIFVSPTGSDTVGDGTIARPYQTIQRAVNAANEYDQVVLLMGTYTGLGNRGLRHHGKRINLKAYMGDRQNTIIDCQHAPDGFILNNNKDSDSPFAGYIDTKDVITRNCENLRIYDI